MMVIAVGGLVINAFGLWILSAGRKTSLNIRGAWLHVLTDALGSVGAIIGGALIWGFAWNWADPIVSILIGVLVIYSSWSLLKESVGVLLEGAPGHIDVDEVRNALVAVLGVVAVHDLHVWSITSGMDALSGHVVVSEAQRGQEILAEMRGILHARYGIAHATIQIETVACSESAVHH